jgi:YesN/AraC family two-component response regulator
MLKMIIADDEKIIRETISSIIDWKAIDIDLVGLCQNGMEAYNTILDENPDIVLSDLKMPGMNGLELIEKAQKTNPETRFIILSGFGEFSYAKEAMKYGVKHYLLKPCNEEQIRESVLECKEECLKLKYTEETFGQAQEAAHRLANAALFNIVNDCICQNGNLEHLIHRYETYIDFDFTAYRLSYVYYLPYSELSSFLAELEPLCKRLMPGILIHGIYVNNTLLLYYRNYDIHYSELEFFIREYKKNTLAASLETSSALYGSLRELLNVIVPKLSRYGLIYYVNDFRATYTCNYKSHIDEVDLLYKKIRDGDPDAGQSFSENLEGISSLPFIKQITSSMLMKLAIKSPGVSSQTLTDWLQEIDGAEDIEYIRKTSMEHVHTMFYMNSHRSRESQLIQTIYQYVNDHLKDPDLSLKFIAENYLYMNVDYVSKKFLKETGIRFSQFLTNKRILRAKELLLSGKYDKIQFIAEEIGLGNNPQYFSQLFKKATGMTPSAFVEQASVSIDV